MQREESSVFCGGPISASSFLPALLETASHRPMSHFCSQQADHRGEDPVWPLGHSYLRQPKSSVTACGFESQNP